MHNWHQLNALTCQVPVAKNKMQNATNYQPPTRKNSIKNAFTTPTQTMALGEKFLVQRGETKK